jgi:site-specific DNA-methyltransferase (adenine-specific)
MNKWKMPTGEYWEKWFIEAYRTLKHGGYLLMYGMDRQLLLFKYYASLAGFQEQQSIYWYYISNFPKATDLSKMIDKNAGAEREVIGSRNNGAGNTKGFTIADERDEKGSGFFKQEGTEIDITVPSTDLAKKYEGYKYSISPLKQTCETIMVFKKPNKTGSVLHDTLAMENGDDTITCSALNIDGNRVDFSKNETDRRVGTDVKRGDSKGLGENKSLWGGNDGINKIGVQMYKDGGRYPAQTFIDSQVAEKLDLQSGIIKSSNNRINKIGTPTDSPTSFGVANKEHEYNDIGGCSKILHKCDYEKNDFDLFIYNPKVSKQERNKGLSVNENNHPTLKPIELNKKILKLFKTPNEQVIIYPFAGSGSEIIGGQKANFRNWFACEKNDNYTKIANARIKHFEEYDYEQLSLFD